MEGNPSTNSSSTDSSSPLNDPPAWRIILYSIFVFFTLIYLTTTTLLFYIRREKITDIQFRSLRLNVLSTVATIMLCVTFSFRVAFWPNAYPCFLIHWPVYMGFFLWCTTLVCRVLSFAWVARFNFAKLRLSKTYLRDSQSQQVLRTGAAISIVINEHEGMEKEKEREREKGSAILSKFRKFKDRATDKWLAQFILCPAMTLAFILTLVLQLTSKDLSIVPVNTVCDMHIELIIMLSFLGFFFFVICPILFYMIYDIHDAYGVRNELVFAMIAGAITYLCFVVFEEAVLGFRKYFGSYVFGWIAFIICHTLNITIPLLRTFKKKESSKLNTSLSRMNSCSSRMTVRNNSGRFAQFMDILGKREFFEQYKKCAAACFCIELILFLEEYQFLKVLVMQCCDPSHVTAVESSILKKPESLHPHDARSTSRYSFTDTNSIMRPVTPVSPGLVSTPCTISIVETISAAKWIPFPNELRNDYKVFYDMFFDSSSDLAINIRGNTVATVKNKIANGEFEIAMFEQAREEVLGLLYRNTFERFCKMYGFEQEGRE